MFIPDSDKDYPLRDDAVFVEGAKRAEGRSGWYCTNPDPAMRIAERALVAAVERAKREVNEAVRAQHILDMATAAFMEARDEIAAVLLQYPDILKREVFIGVDAASIHVAETWVSSTAVIGTDCSNYGLPDVDPIDGAGC